MPFDEEDDLDVLPSKNQGLKKVSSQKSIFDEMPKKPNQQDFDKRVKSSQEKILGYKSSAGELSKKYINLLQDKTLKQNKSLLVRQMEQEIIASMVQLAIDINNDPQEQEGMGSLSWVTLLLKVCLSQNLRMNELEYNISLLENKIKQLESVDSLKTNK